ncbi:hypothetical protein DXV24_22990 [Escherichia albertii]|nr:hypothetical protein [Escherichia albertii]
MPVSIVGVNISKTGNYTILITVSYFSILHFTRNFIILLTKDSNLCISSDSFILSYFFISEISVFYLAVVDKTVYLPSAYTSC